MKKKKEPIDRTMTHIELDVIAALGGYCARCKGGDIRLLEVYRASGRNARQNWFSLYRRMTLDREAFVKGYHLLCPECADQLRLERWRSRFPNHETPYAAAKANVFSLLGDRCAVCGNGDPRVLRIDRADAVSTFKPAWPVYFEMIAESVAAGRNEYRLLCANCKLQNKG